MVKNTLLNHHWSVRTKTKEPATNPTTYKLTWGSSSSVIKVVMNIPLKPYIQAPNAVINDNVVDNILDEVAAVLEQNIGLTP